MTMDFSDANPEGGQSSNLLSDAVPNPRPRLSPCQVCAVRHIAVCGALAPEELQEMSTILVQGTLAAGDDLIYEGDATERAFIVTAGVIKLYKLMADGRCQVIGFAYPGDFSGRIEQRSLQLWRRSSGLQ